jgi:hypothetical protein
VVVERTPVGLQVLGVVDDAIDRLSIPLPGHVRSTRPPFATKSALKVSRSVEAASQVEQDSRLQLSVVVASPAQAAPPLAWPLHVRVEVVVPSPQVAEQMLVVQPDQAPSTGHA